MTRTRAYLAFLVVIALITAWAPKAAAAQRVEFILDGSGSMWAEAGGEVKITTAKRVLKDLIQRLELSSDSTIGLTVYGHRAKGDCKDIERFKAVSHAQRAAFLPVIEKISPKGKTPIADSLQTVGESLKAKERGVSIVLVSDGKESCGKDPCQVARQLRERYGINVAIHVVGFDVRDGQEQLQCIARAGGGRYLSASNARELATAFEDVKAELIKADAATPIVAAAPPAPKPAAPAPMPAQEAEPVNVAAAASGGRIIFFSSEYDNKRWAANNLIDGGGNSWSSDSGNPQSVIIGFKDDRPALIKDILVNPYSSESKSKWVKKVEFLATQDADPLYGVYHPVGSMEVQAVRGEQVLTPDKPVAARYLKANILANHGSNSYMQAGEIMVMGNLLNAGKPAGKALKNLALAKNGGKLLRYSSQYDKKRWAAANLIDGSTTSGHQWSSNSANPQQVTIKLAGGAPHRVHAVGVNPYSAESSKKWVKAVEVLASDKYSYKGYVSLGTLELKRTPDYQMLRLQKPVAAKYVRFNFTSNHGNTSYMQAGELVVLGE